MTLVTASIQIDAPPERVYDTMLDPSMLDARLKQAAQTPIDLSCEPPLRVWLFTLAANRHVLLLLMHLVPILVLILNRPTFLLRTRRTTSSMRSTSAAGASLNSRWASSKKNTSFGLSRSPTSGRCSNSSLSIHNRKVA